MNNMRRLAKVLGTLFIFGSNLAFAEPVLVPESSVSESEEILLEARQKLEAAELLSAQIIESARQESEMIKRRKTKALDVEISLEDVKSEIIALEVRGLNIQSLLSKVMPSHWRVLVDLSEDEENKRIDFIAEKTRDEILFDITQSLGLRYQYFSQIKDSHGNPSPLLVVTTNP